MNELQKLLANLLGVSVSVRAGGTPRGLDGLAGYYMDGAGKTAAAAWFDRALTCSAGGALAMMPGEVLEGGADGDPIPDNLVENATEVLNVLASMLHGVSHVKLAGTAQTPPAPSEIGQLMAKHTDQVWCTVMIEGYGAGVALFVQARNDLADVA